MENKEEEKTIRLKELEDFWDDTIDNLHTRPEEDPLTLEMLLKALRRFIDSKKL